MNKNFHPLCFSVNIMDFLRLWGYNLGIIK